MIPKIQIEKFIAELSQKGYNGTFALPRIQHGDLATNLISYLERTKNLYVAIPFWMSTIIEGNLAGEERISSLMLVNYDIESGFKLDRVKLLLWKAEAANPIKELELGAEVVKMLPNKDQLAQYIRPGLETKRKSKRRHL